MKANFHLIDEMVARMAIWNVARALQAPISVLMNLRDCDS